MDEKKYKLICVRKGKTNYARTNNRKNVTLGSYILQTFSQQSNKSLFGLSSHTQQSGHSIIIIMVLTFKVIKRIFFSLKSPLKNVSPYTLNFLPSL